MKFVLPSSLIVSLAIASCTASTPVISGDPGTSGTSGSAGTPGAAGTGDAAGVSGSAGVGHTAGASGSAGTGGQAGSPGTAGVTGTAGEGTAGFGTAGAGSGTAGTSGAAGAAGSAPPPLTITSADFGNFDNAFLITPCQGGDSGYDCNNYPANMSVCPMNNWSYGNNPTVQTSEPSGNNYTEEFVVSGGDPTKVYDVTVHLLGQAEGRTYTGGTRALSGNVDPGADTNNLLYTGGKPGTTRTDYNVFQLIITPPAGGSPVAGADTYYAFNAVDSAHEGNHYNYGLDETFTMKVTSGSTITLYSHDSNCKAIKNCGPGGPYGFASAAACEAVARTTPPSVTLPTTFRGSAIVNPTKFQTQFLNFRVTSIVAE